MPYIINFINDENIFKQRKAVAISGILTIYFVGYDPENDAPGDYNGFISLISVEEGTHLLCRSCNKY